MTTFVREMSLVYIVAAFEEVLSESLKQVLNYNPKIIRMKEKKASYETIFGHNNYNKLKEELIHAEVTDILRKDIEDINRDLIQIFRIGLDTGRWKEFKEYFYRRNLIIHNKGNINFIYKQKTGYSGKETKLDVDESYLRRAIDDFSFVSKHIVEESKTRFDK